MWVCFAAQTGDAQTGDGHEDVATDGFTDKGILPVAIVVSSQVLHCKFRIGYRCIIDASGMDCQVSARESWEEAEPPFENDDEVEKDNCEEIETEACEMESEPTAFWHS